MSQNVIPKPGRGGRRTLPWVYTSKGALAASGVLKTPRADQVAVAIPRAFDAMSHRLTEWADAVTRIEKMEYDQVSREEFERFKLQTIQAMKGLGAAVDRVASQQPRELAN